MRHLSPMLTLAFGLVQATRLSGQEDARLVAGDQALVQTLLPSLGLARDDAARVCRIVPDPLMQGHDARITQYYRGVKVLGGEGILHLSGPRQRSLTDAFVKNLDLDPTPGVPPPEALAVALADVGAKGPCRVPPSIELLVARLDTGDALVYRVHLEFENGDEETLHRDCFVDAQTGRILRRWSTLQTGRAALGQGNSQYSGVVPLNTTQQALGYELRDWTRGRTGNVTTNANHAMDGLEVRPYQDTSNIWGDGQNYTGGATTSHNGETAAVDSAYGLQATWDYYSKVFGRKGVDDKGTAVTMRVHYGTAFNNAFWSDACYCVSSGDGNYYKSVNCLDVIGHELSHGVCTATAGLGYDGESGALNEANSDIQGVMIKFYARGGSGSTIGSWGGTWTLGEDLAKPEHPGPLRYLYKPSKDGSSPDYWTSELKLMDVHNGSGPMNRCFYLLSQGSSSNRLSDYYTCFLPQGMQGLGNDRAARIWYRALTHYLTSASQYADARNACISAAQDLYGSASAEEAAVWNAFHGINVGSAWK